MPLPARAAPSSLTPASASSRSTRPSACCACAYSSSLAAALSSAEAAVDCVLFSRCATPCVTCEIPCVCCWLAIRTCVTSVCSSPKESTILRSEDVTPETLSAPSPVFECVSSISVVVSRAACAARCARLRTSSATTAKPAPASPARAASTAAFSARMLVWNAISSIVLMMRETRLLASRMPSIDVSIAASARVDSSTRDETASISDAARCT